MINRTIKTIHRLRIYVLCVLVVAFFYYLGANPIQVGKYMGARFGSAVGMSTSVPENPFNRLALDLKNKEDSLAQRERDLAAREKALDSGNDQNALIIGMGIGTVILFFLVALNYYLDYKRKKAAKGMADKNRTGSAGQK